MKKLFFSLAALLLTLTACDSENEFHQTSFNKTGITMYADQPKDSIILYYTDNWKAMLNDASWLSLLDVVKNDQGEILSETKVSTLNGTMEQGVMLMAAPIYVTAEPNTSGRTRYTNILIHSHEGGAVTVMQLPVLNIIYPYYSFKEGTEITSDNILFISNYDAKATAGKVIFTVYRDEATLTSDQEWCVPEKSTFEAGKHEVALTLQPNTIDEERTANLTLTSGGISCTITINQSANSEE